jgi:hypothetical protein
VGSQLAFGWKTIGQQLFGWKTFGRQAFGRQAFGQQLFGRHLADRHLAKTTQYESICPSTVNWLIIIFSSHSDQMSVGKMVSEQRWGSP